MMTSLSRRQFIQVGLGSAAAACLAGSLSTALQAAAGDASKYNILFIPVDDLRPQLGCYGAPGIHTPNIDALAARGLLFNRAYCQQAVCSPSRTSLMTGRRPESVHVYDLKKHFRTQWPDIVTLPQAFQRAGYNAQASGKIYHGVLFDDPSWTTKQFMPHFAGPNAYRNVPPWSSVDVDDSALPDGQIADHAIEAMRSVKDKPFFIAAGFIRPHLPFTAPAKYYDLYPLEKVTLPNNMYPPANVPEVAMHSNSELRMYSDIPPVGPVSDQKARELIRGYYASTSFTDACIGKVIGELDKLGLRDKTIIILWGDHGWQLGEHGLWCKHTNFELSTRAPLIISVPGQKTAGRRTDALVEFVDIYPSLCELCGVAAPAGLEGRSFAPLLQEPARPWKKAAFSLYPRPTEDGIQHMGYSMRTDRYRYTEWINVGQRFPDRGWAAQEDIGWVGEGDKPSAIELYDHQTDPDENANVALAPANASIVKDLARQLRAGWRGALPPA